MSDGIVFQVETGRVLQILAKEIYDSPLAMLRENLQNAYDAVRERFASSGPLLQGGRIEVKIEGNEIIIVDNGVGMDEHVLRENFWKAGSSGKHSVRAKQAGVVGTFGIGAMANFGVCSKLTIVTRSHEAAGALATLAERDNLKIGEECITFEKLETEQPIGTTLSATLDSANSITSEQAKSYLDPYVALLPVPIYLDGELISTRAMMDVLPIQAKQFNPLGNVELENQGFKARFSVSADANAQILVVVSDISVSGISIDGEMALLQSGGQLMGLRSYFGLAPIPVAGNYQFGGYANLPFLQPTAGRDALNRESIDQALILIALAEKAASQMLGESHLGDRSNALLAWISAHGRYDLAKRISILVHPREENVALGDLSAYIGSRNSYQYASNDRSVIGTFANEDNFVVQLSPNQPRRKVQQQYLTSVLRLKQVPHSAQILKVYSGQDLEIPEASVLFRIANILRDDYLVPDVDVAFADISHGVTVLAEENGGTVKLFIAKGNSSVKPLMEIQTNAYELFAQFMKDYVRVNIYPKIQQYVPSSTKGGVEALRKVLLRSKELYRLEESDRGDLEGVLGDYLAGTSSFPAVLKAAKALARPQTQRVSAEQVGSIEHEVPGLVESPVRSDVAVEGQEFMATPPIIRNSISSSMKILTTEGHYPLLNQFTMLLGLSDRLMTTEVDFFMVPHTTRILWGGHRVVYIFTEVTERLSLYYDIELRDAIDSNKTGGGMFATTTLITKERIFVPVPKVLEAEFHVAKGPREFFVRFDLLASRG
ncbi:ATP-binding protein [Pseudomonas fluorescens]|uniref:ATP-binding protein n=1 Tax=Pseudomonas fluorescens TaxID=294 RepID=UPI0007D0487F|nr:ATP-binding protein [Pseudomonas fluorescens]